MRLHSEFPVCDYCKKKHLGDFSPSYRNLAINHRNYCSNECFERALIEIEKEKNEKDIFSSPSTLHALSTRKGVIKETQEQGCLLVFILILVPASVLLILL